MVKGKNSNAMQLGPEDDEPPKRPHCNMEIVVSVDVSSQEEEEVSVEEDSQQKLLLVRSSFDKVSWILSWTSRQDIQWKKLSEEEKQSAEQVQKCSEQAEIFEKPLQEKSKQQVEKSNVEPEIQLVLRE
ncbi:hypothetical protein GOP47_0000271 [Adiantum capillus-veneris]|uniref:Uncharacterized protein n=1 Tax=Adiantum capillus-veneris TaxID=13818 RepID=A0A9D4VEU8_ADICA|nr:hypothetical protein GOP47_0000271 [Adiantum capillus-veneris]